VAAMAIQRFDRDATTPTRDQGPWTHTVTATSEKPASIQSRGRFAVADEATLSCSAPAGSSEGLRVRRRRATLRCGEAWQNVRA